MAPFQKTLRTVTAVTLGLFLISSLAAQEKPESKPQPEFTVDLKPFGAAPDLFTDQSDSKYQQRGVVSVFWLGNDRIVTAFSTNRRWSNSEKPEPLHVRLQIFDRAGKQQNARDWNFSTDGFEAFSTLQLAPGPNNSILAVHIASDPSADVVNKIPDGDFIQVLNPDTSLRQDFYVPSTSSWISNVAAEPSLLLETFYADKHTSITSWSGHPLHAGARLDLPQGTESTTAGPGVAARVVCRDTTHCSGIRVFTAGNETGQPLADPAGQQAHGLSWIYYNPSADLIPVPEVFLSPTALVIELFDSDGKRVKWFVAHRGGVQTVLPDLPKDLQIVGVTSISSDGQRFTVNATREKGLCGVFDFWCKQEGATMVIDIPTNRIVFEQQISAFGGISALSLDGQTLAIIDRNKLAIYRIP